MIDKIPLTFDHVGFLFFCFLFVCVFVYLFVLRSVLLFVLLWSRDPHKENIRAWKIGNILQMIYLSSVRNSPSLDDLPESWMTTFLATCQNTANFQWPCKDASWNDKILKVKKIRITKYRGISFYNTIFDPLEYALRATKTSTLNIERVWHDYPQTKFEQDVANTFCVIRVQKLTISPRIHGLFK